MHRTRAQHKQVQSRPAQRQGKGASIESPQREQITQFNAMAANSPQATAQRKMANMIHNSPHMALRRRYVEKGAFGSPIRSAASPSTHLPIIQGYWMKRQVPKSEDNVAGLEATWVEEATRKRPPYQPYGAKLLLQVSDLTGWSHLPNHHQGTLAAHAPHADDERQGKYGYSMELKASQYHNTKDHAQSPPIGSTVVFNRAGTARVSGHGFSYDEAKVGLDTSSGFPNKGVTAQPTEWFYETPLRSAETAQGSVPELRHTLFGLGRIDFDRERGAYDPYQRGGQSAVDIDALEEMRKALGAKPYFEWGDYSLEKPNTKLGKGGKMALIATAMGLSGTIAFNLDALTSDSARDISSELRDAENDEARMGNFTIAELRYVVTHPAILAKTKFYERGELISHREAEDLLGVRFEDL